jgi:diguanylate cyclase
MRPQDTLARFGGEEFVILLPDTPLEKGVDAMTRLQRELTKRFFMAGTEKVLITFSAGVAQMTNDEPGMDAIRRADQAMYLAKRTGKNRVVSA